MSWLKFAIQGSTYARALMNAGQRAGRNMDALKPGLDAIAAQPQAKLKPGLSSMVRERGALQPTAQQADMQKMLARTPWAGAEHGGSEHAVGHLNAMLKRRGLEHNTPAGQPTTHDMIHKTFGPPQAAFADPVTRKVPYRGRGDNPMELMDEYRVPGKTPMPDAGTRVGPAPAPTRESARAARLPAQPKAGPVNPEQTFVSHGEWRPDYIRSLPPNLQAQIMAARGGPVAGAATASPIGGRALSSSEATNVLPVKAASLPLAAGIGIPLAVGGGLLLSKPGIKADLTDRLTNDADLHQKDDAQAIPANVTSAAQRAAQALAERGIDPAQLRIAVDAPSGAGKTVLSKALAQQLGVKHYGLDWRPNMRMHQLMGGGDIENMPHAPRAGEIVEHQQLLRSYDPELFDAAIHIRRDPATIKQQLLQRGRGARTADLLDYDKSIAVGGLAFDTLGGEMVDLGDGVQLKLRPREGWGNSLDQQLMQRGIDPNGLSRHEKLLSLHAGERTTGSGWKPYAKNPFTPGETLALGASVPLGIMAAKALARRP